MRHLLCESPEDLLCVGINMCAGAHRGKGLDPFAAGVTGRCEQPPMPFIFLFLVFGLLRQGVLKLTL